MQKNELQFLPKAIIKSRQVSNSAKAVLNYMLKKYAGTAMARATGVIGVGHKEIAQEVGIEPHEALAELLSLNLIIVVEAGQIGHVARYAFNWQNLSKSAFTFEDMFAGELALANNEVTYYDYDPPYQPPVVIQGFNETNCNS